MVDMRHLTNVLACAIAEAGEAPEGYLYVAVMHAGRSLDDFMSIKALLVDLGLVTEEPGPILRATRKLVKTYETAKAANRDGYGQH